MRIFVSHMGMDFDSLASMYAAKKLYGKGKICSIGKKKDNVHMFLKLYYKYFPIEKYSHIKNMNNIDEVVIVDTRRTERLGKFAEILKKIDPRTIIYDHHPEGDIVGDENYVEQIGSVTTLIVEKLFDKNIPINDIEANLFLLGIYEDTGSLRYPNTTYRDVNIVSKLLQAGGKLDIISSYLNRKFDKLQENLLKKMMDNIQEYEINEIKINISVFKIKEIVGGISDVVHKVNYLKNLKSIFVIIGMGNKTHIVGRTSMNSLNINKIMVPFGGGGHIKAGSATVYETDIYKLRDQLIDVLKDNVRPALVAEDIMSYPVLTVKAEVSIEKATEEVEYSYYMNYPVINNKDEIIGWVPKKKIYEFYDRGEKSIPIKGIMNHDLIFVKKNTPFRELEETFLRGKVSIIIVGDKKKMHGVISPSDIIRILHAQ